MLTPPNELETQFNSCHLQKNSSFKEGSDDKCDLVELSFKLYVFI